MLNTLKRIFSDGKLMGKLLFTLLVLMVFRFGTFIPVPLIETTRISGLFEGNDFLTILNVFSGGGLSNFSILALGISPYITASIVTQMLQMLLPSFQEMAEQGEVGKQKLNRITRYLAIVLAFIQALVLLFGLGAVPQNILQPDLLYGNENIYWLFYIYMALVITAGSAFVMWLADMITRHGIGNGTSMIISAGIVTSVPAMFGALHNMYIIPGVSFGNIAMFATIVLLYVLMILFVVFMEAAKRKIPVQYANRQAGPKSTSDIPVKLNSAGVIPVIFAATLMSIPLTIVGVIGVSPTSNWGFWLDQIFNNQNVIGMVLYILLIFFFSFFYSFLMVDPDKIAENLSKQGAFVPGYRPGEDTRRQISKILFRTTLIGATYLSFVAMVPILVTRFFGFTGSDAMAISIGGTSILILVGVAVETVKQLETSSQTNDYKGFID